MGIFKEIKCARCNRKANLMTRIKLKDGNYLCAECTKEISVDMYKNLDNYTLEEFESLLQYKNYSNEKLRPIFKQTHLYHSLHLDSEHGLLWIGNFMNEQTIIFKLCNIDEFTLFFKADEYKEGLVGNKVYGRVLLRIKVRKPYFYLEEVLQHKAKGKAEKGFFGSEIKYENPKDMDDFLLHFNMSWAYSNESERNAQYWNTEEEQIPSELQKAMAVFILDNLDITLEELKAHRKRLLKAFHPDNSTDDDTRYAQKINQAYEIIKSYIEKNS